MSVRYHPFFRNLSAYIFLIVLGFLIAFPLLLILSQSLMSNKEVFQWPPLVTPEHAFHVLEIMIKAHKAGQDGRARTMESTFIPPIVEDAAATTAAHLVHDRTRTE